MRSPGLKIKNYNYSSMSGFSLIEVLLATVLFGALVSVLVGAILYGQESMLVAGYQSRAVFLAQEGAEAVRNIRDEHFANLQDGTYGLVFQNGVWNLSGQEDTNGIYNRSIVISSIGTTTKDVLVKVTWKPTAQRDGVFTLESRLTNWKRN